MPLNSIHTPTKVTAMQLSLMPIMFIIISTCAANVNTPHLLAAALLAPLELQQHECIIQLLLQRSLLINNLLVAVEPAWQAAKFNNVPTKGFLWNRQQVDQVGGTSPSCT